MDMTHEKDTEDPPDTVYIDRPVRMSDLLYLIGLSRHVASQQGRPFEDVLVEEIIEDMVTLDG